VGEMSLATPSPVVQLVAKGSAANTPAKLPPPAVSGSSDAAVDEEKVTTAPVTYVCRNGFDVSRGYAQTPAPPSATLSTQASEDMAEDDELYFNFKVSSPSAAFYKKQAAKGPKSTLSFEPQYNKIPNFKQPGEVRECCGYTTMTFSPVLGSNVVLSADFKKPRSHTNLHANSSA
jgi:hypothetical protein